MRLPEHDRASATEAVQVQFDLENIGLQVLSGQPLSSGLRRAGFVALGRDIDETSGVAAVWLARHPGSPDSMQRGMLFERIGTWRYLGGGGGSGRKLSLAGRESARQAGPAAMMSALTSCSARSRADREALRGDEDHSSQPGWVACAAFRLASEVFSLQVGDRQITVPQHGYVIVSWKAPPARGGPARPLIAAIGADGSRLTELSSGDPLDSLTRAAVEAAIEPRIR